MPIKNNKSVQNSEINKVEHVIYLLTIFLLPTQFGKHFWPIFATVAGLRIDYLSPTLYVIDLLIVFLVFIQLYKIGIDIKKILLKKYIAYALSQTSTRLIILFIITSTLGVLMSERIMLGLYGLVRLAEFIFFAWLTQRLLKNNSLRLYTFFLFAASILFQSFLAILQFVNNGSLNGILYFFGERTFTAETPGIANASLGNELYLRPYATFPHPNVLAGYLLLSIVLLKESFAQAATRAGKQFIAIVLVVSSIALLFTLSRVAIILAVFYAAYLFLKNINTKIFEKAKTKKIYLTAIISLFVIYLISSPFALRFTTLNLNDESIIHRQRLASASFKMLKENPVFGVGLNHFIVRLPDFNETYEIPMQPVHNIYLLTATETGIVGLIIFLSYIFITIKKIIKSNYNNYSTAIILLSFILIIGMFDHYFLTIQQGRLIFSFVLGIINVNKNKQK